MFVKDIVRILASYSYIISIEFNWLLLLYRNRILYTFRATGAASAAAGRV